MCSVVRRDELCRWFETHAITKPFKAFGPGRIAGAVPSGRELKVPIFIPTPQRQTLSESAVLRAALPPANALASDGAEGGGGRPELIGAAIEGANTGAADFATT